MACDVFNLPNNTNAYIDSVLKGLKGLNTQGITITACDDLVENSNSSRRLLLTKSANVNYKVIIVAEGQVVPQAVYNSTIHTMQVYMTGPTFLALLQTSTTAFSSVSPGPVQGTGFSASPVIYPTMDPTVVPSLKPTNAPVVTESSKSKSDMSIIILYTTIAGAISATLGILFKLYQIRKTLKKKLQKIFPGCFKTEYNEFEDGNVDEQQAQNKVDENVVIQPNIINGNSERLTSERVNENSKKTSSKKKKEVEENEIKELNDDDNIFLHCLNMVEFVFSLFCCCISNFQMIKQMLCRCFKTSKPPNEPIENATNDSGTNV